MKVAAILLLLIGLAAFIGMDACHVTTDKVIRSTDVLCQMLMPVAIGSIVLGLLLGLIDILRKSRRR